MKKYFLKNGSEARISRADTDDLSAISDIYDGARRFMRSVGNTEQWSNGYPSKDDSMRDVADGTLYKVTVGNIIAAVFCMLRTPEPTYEIIYSGSWEGDAPYTTVHRIAVADGFRSLGVAGVCFDFALEVFGEVRADTHRDNIPMQRALISNGFSYRGIIHLKNGDERLAYQKIDNERVKK